MSWKIEKVESFALTLKAVKGLCSIYGFIVIILWMIKGNLWFSEVILRIHMILFFASVSFSILLIIPLLAIHSLRPYASIMLDFISVIIIGTMWFYSAFFCINYLGIFWLIFGLLAFGFGVTPIALIGSALMKEWAPFESLIIMLVTIGILRLIFYYSHKSVIREMIRIKAQEDSTEITEEEIEEIINRL
jgi:hypothetical protein